MPKVRVVTPEAGEMMQQAQIILQNRDGQLDMPHLIIDFSSTDFDLPDVGSMGRHAHGRIPLIDDEGNEYSLRLSAIKLSERGRWVITQFEIYDATKEVVMSQKIRKTADDYARQYAHRVRVGFSSEPVYRAHGSLTDDAATLVLAGLCPDIEMIAEQSKQLGKYLLGEQVSGPAGRIIADIEGFDAQIVVGPNRYGSSMHDVGFYYNMVEAHGPEVKEAVAFAKIILEIYETNWKTPGWLVDYVAPPGEDGDLVWRISLIGNRFVEALPYLKDGVVNKVEVQMSSRGSSLNIHDRLLRCHKDGNEVVWRRAKLVQISLEGESTFWAILAQDVQLVPSRIEKVSSGLFEVVDQDAENPFELKIRPEVAPSTRDRVPVLAHSI